MKALLFFKRVAGLLLLNALIKPLWIFGVDRQVQNRAGHEAYGTYFSLLALSLVFSFLTDAGFSNMVNQQIASGKRYPVGQLLRIKGLLAAVYSGLVLAVAVVTGVRAWRLLLPLLLIQILLSFFNFLRSLITAQQLFGQDVWLSVLDKGLMLTLFLPVLYTPLFQIPTTIPFFLHAQLLCTALSAGVAAWIVIKNGLVDGTAASQRVMDILKSVAPYALIILTMSLHNRLDGFLLERLHPKGAYEAGLYAAAYRLLDAANMVGYLVASFLVPFVARHRANTALVQETVITARQALLLFGFFAALFLVAFAGPVQQALYPRSALDAAQVLQWCLPVLPAYLLLQVYGSLLTAMGQLKLFLSLLFIAVVLNSVLNVLLIPRWGAVGCCIAALASQYVCAVSVYGAATRRNKLAHDGKGWLFLAVTAALLAGLFYVGKRLAAPPALLLFAGAAVSLLALFAYLPAFKRYSLSR